MSYQEGLCLGQGLATPDQRATPDCLRVGAGHTTTTNCVILVGDLGPCRISRRMSVTMWDINQSINQSRLHHVAPVKTLHAKAQMSILGGNTGVYCHPRTLGR